MNIAGAHFDTLCAVLWSGLEVCVIEMCHVWRQPNMWSLPFVLAEKKAV